MGRIAQLLQVRDLQQDPPGNESAHHGKSVHWKCHILSSSVSFPGGGALIFSHEVKIRLDPFVQPVKMKLYSDICNQIQSTNSLGMCLIKENEECGRKCFNIDSYVSSAPIS